MFNERANGMGRGRVMASLLDVINARTRRRGSRANATEINDWWPQNPPKGAIPPLLQRDQQKNPEGPTGFCFHYYFIYKMHV